MKLYMEQHNIKPVSVPVDMNTAAITGARVGLSKADRVAIVCHMGDSTAAVTEFTLKQHTAISAGTSKNLSITNPYYHKKAALDVFTKVTPGSATAVYDVSSIFANDEGIIVFEVLGEDLDVDGGFAFISVDVADSTASKILSAVYVLSDVRHSPAYSNAI